jgi:hypothetical protein
VRPDAPVTRIEYIMSGWAHRVVSPPRPLTSPLRGGPPSVSAISRRTALHHSRKNGSPRGAAGTASAFHTQNEMDGIVLEWATTGMDHEQLACSRFGPAASSLLGENRLGAIIRQILVRLKERSALLNAIDSAVFFAKLKAFIAHQHLPKKESTICLLTCTQDSLRLQLSRC